MEEGRSRKAGGGEPCGKNLQKKERPNPSKSVAKTSMLVGRRPDDGPGGSLQEVFQVSWLDVVTRGSSNILNISIFLLPFEAAAILIDQQAG